MSAMAIVITEGIERRCGIAWFREETSDLLSGNSILNFRMCCFYTSVKHSDSYTLIIIFAMSVDFGVND